MSITVTKVTNDDTKAAKALDPAVCRAGHAGRFMPVAGVFVTFVGSFVTFVGVDG